MLQGKIFALSGVEVAYNNSQAMDENKQKINRLCNNLTTIP